MLLPADHPLAALPAVRLAALRGEVVDANPYDTRALEWADLVRQFLALTGARSTPPHVPAIGLEEQGYHLVRQGVPILTAIDHIEVPGGVVRALVDPVPLYAWSLIRRREPDRRDSDTLLAIADSSRGPRNGCSPGTSRAATTGCPNPRPGPSSAGDELRAVGADDVAAHPIRVGQDSVTIASATSWVVVSRPWALRARVISTMRAASGIFAAPACPSRRPGAR